MQTTRFCSLVSDTRSIVRAAVDLRAMSRRISQVAWLSVAVMVVLFPVLVSTAIAQSTTGSVYGQITDQTGAVVVNARVTAINSGTSVTYRGASDAWGNYTVFNLPPGIYNLTVEQDRKSVV
jgi:hypothetical protein